MGGIYVWCENGLANFGQSLLDKLKFRMKNSYLICFVVIGLLSFSCLSERSGTNSPNEQIPKIDYESKLSDLGITIPLMKPPSASYVHTVRTGNLIYTSGKGSVYPNGMMSTGKLGVDLSIAQGQEAAKLAGIRLLGALKSELGDLNRVKRIVKVLGMVNASPEFVEHSSVINGFSDLMIAVFGDIGKHARSAVGVGSLPKNLAVEIEMIVEVYPDY